MEKIMTAGEYISAFAATVLHGLTIKHNDVVYSDALDELQSDIDKLPFIVKYGKREFEYGQDPEEHAKTVLVESNVRIDIPVNIAQLIAEMLVIVLIDEWSRTDLYR